MIRNYHILPYWAVNIMAIWLPWIEFIVGIFLILGIYEKGSALVMNVVLIIFIIALSSALARGIDIACGCFSTSAKSGKVGLTRIIEDILMLLGGIIIMLKGGGIFTVPAIFKK